MSIFKQNLMSRRDVLDKTFQATNAYQLGAPNPTQVGIQKSYNWMYHPMNSEWRNNKLIPGLINVILTQQLNSKSWTNPMAGPFKRFNGPDAAAIEEMQVRLIKSRAYTPKAQGSILEYNPPEVEVAIHVENRQDYYPVTLNPYEVRKAIVAGEYALSNLVTAALEAAATSDNIDEYNIMINQLALHDTNKGFYRVEVPEMSPKTVKEDVDTFIETLQTYAAKLGFVSAKYNPYGMETFCRPEELVLITTPEIYAKINVKSLAQAFNVSYVDFKQRVVIVDEIPIKDCYALLLDENWFVCGDTLFESTNFFNGATLNTNHWLHHWGTYSCSPMLNAIAFVKDGATVDATVTVTPGDFDFDLYGADGSVAENIVLGEENYLKGALSWTTDPEVKNFPTEFVPTVFEVESIVMPADPEVEGSEDVALKLNSRTYVDNFGLIHFQAAVVPGMVVTVKATSTYNSAGVGTAEDVTATKSFVISE